MIQSVWRVVYDVKYKSRTFVRSHDCFALKKCGHFVFFWQIAAFEDIKEWSQLDMVNRRCMW